MQDTRPKPDDRKQIVAVLRACHSAMVGARTDELDALVEPDFALVHITGYEQPKDEWFDVMRTRRFDYHRIDIDEQSLSLTVTAPTAEVTGRGVFDATINGMRRPWRLQFAIRFAKVGGRWIIAHARYTSS